MSGRVNQASGDRTAPAHPRPAVRNDPATFRDFERVMVGMPGSSRSSRTWSLRASSSIDVSRYRSSTAAPRRRAPRRFSSRSEQETRVENDAHARAEELLTKVPEQGFEPTPCVLIPKVKSQGHEPLVGREANRVHLGCEPGSNRRLAGAREAAQEHQSRSWRSHRSSVVLTGEREPLC